LASLMSMASLTTRSTSFATRATELVEQGQRLEIVQRVLGHRDPRSTQGYAELAEAQVREALEIRR